FFMLAEGSCLPNVVAPEQVSDAVGQDEVMFSLASMIGQTLGPILYNLGRTLPFLTDAISYVVSVVSLLFIKVRFQAERDSEQDSQPHLWQEIKEGVAWLWRNPLMRLVTILS